MKFFKITLILLLTLVVSAEKVEITSDSMYAEDINHEIHFIGNAKVKQLKDWITADKIVVYLDDNNKTKIYKAFGNADFEFENEKGHYLGSAELVEYNPNTSVYILTDKANVKDLINNRTAKGDKMTVNMLTGKSKVIGTTNRPVKFTLDMGN
ncbi:OstA family organic solvent tolerance protein [hydrothermal vent metagenome]|uniref:OstA family organic solvent tolerance protein n=1 Tax=hydrothermal vent metagenome TaxID=652676 RepID=A0A1W1CZH0_9ZZZZ